MILYRVRKARNEEAAVQAVDFARVLFSLEVASLVKSSFRAATSV